MTLNPAFQARALMIAQLVLVLLIIALAPGNLTKLGLLLVVWAVTFRSISRAEGVLALFACVFFTGMNFMSLKQGIFAFTQPDLLGMPYYELVMWGWYLVHVTRMVGGPPPDAPPGVVTWALALLYALAFATISQASLLLLVTGILLCAALLVFHSRHDLLYTGYMVALGAAIEYTGVLSGQWHYPGDPMGGVPLWFITLWGGVGLFLRRLVHPILKLPA